ncbi:25526_t:CDS:2 [Dentiscutata erythropus]|uniref:25526_t:CDS:1 n=1 Tax=Dentiscutata erythropus TaxID=1348616 RepID=A0A9N9FXA6_9GLOM|nr:25526_t:CDS:2 [Dentiscutata erythropus]
MTNLSDIPTISFIGALIVLSVIYSFFYYLYKNGIKAVLSFLSTLCIFLIIGYTLLLIVFIKPNVPDDNIEKLREQVFFFPEYNSTSNTFECLNNSIDYSELQSKSSHTTIVNQLSGFSTIAVLLFNIVVYGVTSRLECFFEYDVYCTPKKVDSIYFFILSTVITRSISSFFSHDKDIKVVELMKHGFKFDNGGNEGIPFYRDPYKFVFLTVLSEEHVSRLLGQQRLYLNADLDDDRKSIRRGLFAKKLIKHALVYMNILETGIFQYFTYSHRANTPEVPKDVPNKVTNEVTNEETNEKPKEEPREESKEVTYKVTNEELIEVTDKKKKKRDSKDSKKNKKKGEGMLWLVIPDIYEFSDYDRYNFNKRFKTEKDIEKGTTINDIDGENIIAEDFINDIDDENDIKDSKKGTTINDIDGENIIVEDFINDIDDENIIIDDIKDIIDDINDIINAFKKNAEPDIEGPDYGDKSDIKDSKNGDNTDNKDDKPDIEDPDYGDKSDIKDSKNGGKSDIRKNIKEILVNPKQENIKILKTFPDKSDTV